ADDEAKPVKKKKAKKRPSEDDSKEDDDARPKKKEKEPEPEKAPEKEKEKEKDEGPDPPSFSIEIKEGRSTVGVNYQANANGQPATEAVTMATCLIVRMKGGADSGFNGAGVRPSFRFRAKDNEELRALAQEDAIKRGRARAQRLASIV